jgi:hypothetical protein
MREPAEREWSPWGSGDGPYGTDSGRAYRGPYEGLGPKGYQRSDDRICEEVCEALTRHGDIDASGVDVEVHGGEVTLTGTVDTRTQKRRAEDIAYDVSGVRDVHNRLRAETMIMTRGGESITVSSEGALNPRRGDKGNLEDETRGKSKMPGTTRSRS